MDNNLIYADNAATTQLDRDALSEMMVWLDSEFGNASQPYSFSRKPKSALFEAKERIANSIGAKPNEIYFTSGGTESDNWAIKGVRGNNERQEVITSAIEHHAVLNACKALECMGVPTITVSVDGKGVVTPELLKASISSKTNLVSVMFANNEIGTIEPILELANLAHENGALFHTDAVQAVGHVPINVKELGVDLLSASAHKFNGPKGIGFLYVKDGLKIHPFIHGGSQENGLRAGTENVASIVGMAKALEKNCQEMDIIRKKLKILETLTLQTLDSEGVDYIRNGSGNRLPGNVNVSIRGADGEMLLHRLDLMGIMVSTGSACDSKQTQVSHVIKAIGVPPEYAEGTIRISYGKDNTEQEAITIAKAISKVLELSNYPI